MLTKHLFKALGTSMLAAIGVMAVSASAAQAKWLILVGTNSVLHSENTGTMGLHALLVPGLLQIECHKGTVGYLTQLSADHTQRTVKEVGGLEDCLVKDSNGKVNVNCSVDSPGGAANTITSKGEGTATMEGSKIFATLKSENFSEIEINGALCPLDEFDDTVNGAQTITIDNAGSKTTSKTVLIDDAGLFYGENSMSIHDGVNTANPASGTISRVGGGEWLIGLVGL